jgi:enoyl-CoA hydratase
MENPFSPVIEIEEHGAVRLVRLNRPEFLNAVNSELHHALVGIWDHLASDEQTRAAVITGNGRAFSAGGDMDHFKVVHEDREARDKDMQLARQLVLNALECPLPIVAAINGPAVGLGCSLAVLCDVVLMSEQAFIADPHVAMGLTAGDGGAPLWPLFMSMLQAKQYLLSGDRI